MQLSYTGYVASFGPFFKVLANAVPILGILDSLDSGVFARIVESVMPALYRDLALILPIPGNCTRDISSSLMPYLILILRLNISVSRSSLPIIFATLYNE